MTSTTTQTTNAGNLSEVERFFDLSQAISATQHRNTVLTGRRDI